MKIVDYKILSARSALPGAGGLVEYVNKEIEAGWEPLGGIAVMNDGAKHHVYYQAMVKKSIPKRKGK